MKAVLTLRGQSLLFFWDKSEFKITGTYWYFILTRFLSDRNVFDDGIFCCGGILFRWA